MGWGNETPDAQLKRDAAQTKRLVKEIAAVRAALVAAEARAEEWKSLAIEEGHEQIRLRDEARARVAAVEARHDKLLRAVESVRDTMHREHGLGRFALDGYVRLLSDALDENSLAKSWTVKVTRDETDGGFVAGFTPMPGCMSDGDTIPDALCNLADAMREVAVVRAVDLSREIASYDTSGWLAVGDAPSLAAASSPPEDRRVRVDVSGDEWRMEIDPASPPGDAKPRKHGFHADGRAVDPKNCNVCYDAAMAAPVPPLKEDAPK